MNFCRWSRYKMYERLNWHLLKVDQELFGIKRRYRWRHPLKVWRLFSMLKWSAFLILVLGLTIVKVPPVEIEFEYYQKLDVVRQSSSNLWVEGDSHLFFHLFFYFSKFPQFSNFMPEGMCKPHYDTQDFPHCQLILLWCNHLENPITDPITDMPLNYTNKGITFSFLLCILRNLVYARTTKLDGPHSESLC